MPHDHCPPSRRGHSWRELTVADQIGPRLSRGSITAPIKIAPDLRLCKQCGALGRVSNQGVIHVVGGTVNDAPTAWQTAAATIFVKLGRDNHLASCELAKAGGPDATLACAECGRALWMHSTRHDTCGQFCWVTERTLTDRQIGILGTIPDLPDMIRQACARVLNDYGLAPYYVREAKRTCAVAINSSKQEARKKS